MSAESTGPKPILLPSREIQRVTDLTFSWPVDVLDPLLQARREDPTVPDGAIQAAKMLLTEAAVCIQFVDINQPQTYDDDVSGEPRKYYEYHRKTMLGFNDHNGGSESNFKILLNRYDLPKPTQFVLHSPPTAEAASANTTFYASDFTFLTSPPPPHLPSETPNPLKTFGVTHLYGRNDYQFILLGDETVPQRFAGLFEKMGFDFIDTPMPGDLYDEMYFNRWAPPQGYYDNLGHSNWPGEQFAQQVEILGKLANLPDIG